MTTDEVKLMTLEEASAVLRVKVSTLRAWRLKKKWIPFVKIGRRVFLRHGDCISLIESSVAQPGEQNA